MQRLLLIASLCGLIAVRAQAETLTYQWYKNGQPIPGATGPTYTTPPTTLEDSGAQYYVVVANEAGSTSSSAATLTVVAPPPQEGSEVMFDGLLPASAELSEKTNYELGTVFRPTTDGTVVGVRYYATPSEDGSHRATIWRNDTNSLLAGPFTLGADDGWNEFTLPIPVSVSAGVSYTVSVTTGTDTGRAYVDTTGFFASAGNNGEHISWPANAGVYATTMGSRPTAVWNASNYFRDVVFVPAGGGGSQVATIFGDDFESALTWTKAGDASWYTGAPHDGTHGVRLTVIGSIEKPISLAGYSGINVAFSWGAKSLDNAENVQALYYDGAAWQEFARINNGDMFEDGQLHPIDYSLPDSVNNLPSFALRFKINSSGAGDYAYIDNVVVKGTKN
ncbi:MAG: DUF4082 domain-containing protein [Rhodospirillales bacterium]